MFIFEKTGYGIITQSIQMEDFNRSREQFLPGSLVHKRKEPNWKRDRCTLLHEQKKQSNIKPGRYQSYAICLFFVLEVFYKRSVYLGCLHCWGTRTWRWLRVLSCVLLYGIQDSYMKCPGNVQCNFYKLEIVTYYHLHKIMSAGISLFHHCQ